MGEEAAAGMVLGMAVVVVVGCRGAVPQVVGGIVRPWVAYVEVVD